MANFIEAFVMVQVQLAPRSPSTIRKADYLPQYNALLDLASNNGSFYSPVWTGPQILTKLPWGQLSAMDVLNAAIGMVPMNGCIVLSICYVATY